MMLFLLIMVMDHLVEKAEEVVLVVVHLVLVTMELGML